jgi:DNA replication protein DnaC
MLTHPTIDKLQQLRLTGMVSALTQQSQSADIEDMGFEDRLGLIVDQEMAYRESRQLTTRLRRAKLKEQASPENIDFRSARGLDRMLFQALLGGQWIKRHQNILITGSTGAGKTYLACALVHQACRDGHTAQYYRLPRLMNDLSMAKAVGRYAKMLDQIAKVNILILDDWGFAEFEDATRRDLLEIFDDRHNKSSTIVTSQLPVEKWHHALGDATMADAILDRLVHNAHRINLIGDSMRQKMSSIDKTTKKQDKASQEKEI